MSTRVAIIDDDPVEMTIISFLADKLGGDYVFTPFLSVEAFAADPQATDYDLVFLDRRIPPHESFEASLPMVEASGFVGPVVLLSAHAEPLDHRQGALQLEGPYDKMQLHDANFLKKLLDLANI